MTLLVSTWRRLTWRQVLCGLVGLLIVKVTIGVVLRYRDYFPPNFDAEFLWGRDSYFWGAYAAAFYAHVLTGPLTLLLGLVLMAEPLRMRFPQWHRSLGKVQAALVLLVLAPSGLAMACWAGATAGIPLAFLALGTAGCVGLGWRAAVRRRFAEHRRWMTRCFALLCSAVVLRVIGGLLRVTGLEGAWSYPLAVWASWLLPLAAVEWSNWRTSIRQSVAAQPVRVQSASASSLPAIETRARS